ncbi:MAG: cell division protein FtsZ [Alphaproteobacteria bacterium]|nr:cell division protein FtsZ [Alphaproteobacteria bacterium]
MLDISPAEIEKLQARIVVIGAGGAGCNAINNMIEKKLPGVQFVAMNTDTQSLGKSVATTKIQLGIEATEGLGAGSNPDVGRAAALESEQKIQTVLKNAHMVFITAGMGGGTGTGAAPVIARLSREMGILTVGVVTKPFKFERKRRAEIAETGISELQQFVDTLIVIPNENLFRLTNGPTTLTDAFGHADDVLLSGVRGVTDLIVQEGRINLDFNDIKTVMKEMGKAVMGTGEASGENRATDAALKAINNPLLEDISLRGASSVLINITSGIDVTLAETNEAVNCITEEVSEDALVIFGLTISEELGDNIRISVIATGVDAEAGIGKPASQALTVARASIPTVRVAPTPAVLRSPQFVAAPVLESEVIVATPEEETAESQAFEPGSSEPEDGLFAPTAPENMSLHQAALRPDGYASPIPPLSPPPAQLGDTPTESSAVVSVRSPLSELRRRSHQAKLGSKMPSEEGYKPASSGVTIPSFLRR